MRTTAHKAMATGVAAAALAIAAAPGAVASGEVSRAAASVRVTGSGIGGFTSQDLPIVVKLSRDGRKIVRAAAAIGLKCTSGDQFIAPDEHLGLRISSTGRFHETLALPPVDDGSGETVAYDSSISGRTNAARTVVHGTWRLTLTFHDTTSGATDTCRSGKVRFKVSR